MISIYLFFLTVKVFCTMLAGYYRLKMAFMPNTDTRSNIYFFFGYVLALMAQSLGIFNTSSVVSLLSAFDPWIVVFSQVIGAGVFVFFLAGTIRKYSIYKPI